MPSAGWLESSAARVAVPGAPETPGKKKSGLLRPLWWQLSQARPARAAWPPRRSGVLNAARPTSTQ